ncbi:MAG: 2-oxoacid:acceptor oxidoreductase family protein [Elusimicrobiota bacterium]|jgi:2-oxoglutarate ferredoxin oxidoreductase subunit gamma|nr:2-oxoacid:acceptor oxidoreductase family protein [Elusimicrobiota bacterium]
MKNEIIVSGFGGQGVLLAGFLIAQSAMEQGLNTSWFPSYGAEMRGGTANSTAIVSDTEIGSPVSFNPNALIALSPQALGKFLPKLAKGAAVISPIKTEAVGEFVYHYIDVLKIASDIGNIKTANIVAVGALSAVLKKEAGNGIYIHKESVFAACKKVFASKPDLIEINKTAFLAGYNLIKD